MPTPMPLPIETLAHIFRFLEPQDLFQCLVVSQAWHSLAEAQLYSDVLLDPINSKSCIPLLSALKTRRHLLRSFGWLSNSGRSSGLQFELMDILLDYRPRGGGAGGGAGGNNDNHDCDISFDDSNDSSEVDSDQYSLISCRPLQHSTLILVNKLGPNRPVALKRFSFEGNGRSKLVLDSIMYCLTTLTTLELLFPYSDTAEMHKVDVERILELLPYLKTLAIEGWMHDYVSIEESAAARAGLKGYDRHVASSDTTTTTELMTQYRLERFTFDQRLTSCAGPDAFAIFKRLGNLRRICITSLMSDYDCYVKSRPWALGRALRDFCPKLEAVETDGTVALWLYDLPIYPSSTTPQQVATEESDVIVQQQRRRLQELEREELLRGQTAVPFFPQLKELVFGPHNTLSYQDLISLGVQARFLTTLKIRYEEPRRQILWEMYEMDAPFAGASSTTGTSGTSMEEALIEAMRLRKRRPFVMRDLVLFLQHCSSLRYLFVSSRSITHLDLIDSTGAEQGDEKALQQVLIRPWACEATLETLDIGLRIHGSFHATQHKERHTLVWKHLGRLRNLRSLSLPFSVLDPSFSHGIEGLIGGGLAATVQEIRHLPGWWKLEYEDRKALVLWFARSCPRLVVLGFEYKRAYSEGEEGVEQTRFLEDVEVKRCGILKVFIESEVSLDE